MKAHLFFISALSFYMLCPLWTKAQTSIQTTEITSGINDDDSWWYNWSQQQYTKIGIPDLTKTTDTFHFRFATETRVVDVYTQDYKVFCGSMAYCTTSTGQTPGYAGRSKPEFFGKKYILDTAICRRFYDLFASLGIFHIPPQSNIKGWQRGLDGNTYMIECAGARGHSYRTYWTPSAFKDSISEAAMIDCAATGVDYILSTQESFGTFIDGLPPGCYSAGGYGITCRRPSFLIEETCW